MMDRKMDREDLFREELLPLIDLMLAVGVKGAWESSISFNDLYFVVFIS